MSWTMSYVNINMKNLSPLFYKYLCYPTWERKVNF